MARLFSYVVARDYGFAPNPFYGYCTLATCKPKIRTKASTEDWIVGTGSATCLREGHLVYAMRITETMSFDEYWNDPRFQFKKANLYGSKKQAFGDNIYHQDSATGVWIQENSHHSYDDGRQNIYNIKNDTQAPRVLISEDYVYWGGVGPKIPERFRDLDGKDVCKKGPGHRNDLPEEMVIEFTSWIRSLGQIGYQGMPLDWSRTA